MAKAKTTKAEVKAKAKDVKKTAKKVAAETEDKAVSVTAMLRKGVLAYVGMYGAAYEQAQARFNQAREATDGLFDTFVEKGEEMEAQANEYFKDTQSKVTKTYEENVKKVKSMLPASANDRVEELEAELASLNKKVVAASKKATVSAKKTAEKIADKVEEVAEKAA